MITYSGEPTPYQSSYSMGGTAGGANAASAGGGNMGWAAAAAAAYSAYMQYKAAKQGNQSQQALPTYYMEYMSPQQQTMWGMIEPKMQEIYGGQLPRYGGYDIPSAEGMMPNQGWYNSLDPNVRAGIEEPYMQGMDMMRNQLQGGGQLGSERAGMSGAAADVMGQYMQKAAPSMAMTGWGMTQPAQQSLWQAMLQRNMTQAGTNYDTAMMPYQSAMTMLPQAQSDLLISHYPTIQQVQPGATIPTNIMDVINQYVQQTQEAEKLRNAPPSADYFEGGTP